MDRICFNCMWEKRSEEGPCEHCGFDNASYTAKENHLPPMTVLADKYLLGKAIGSGGFGITYIAMDLRLRMVVAVKELYVNRICIRTGGKRVEALPSHQERFRECRERFLREARILAMFHEKEDEGIVSVRDHFEENDTAYLVMDYLQGKTLREYVADQGPQTPQQTEKLLKPVFRALIKVHQFGILHRDICPENIMVQSDGRVCLLDFGGFDVIREDDSPDSDRIWRRGYTPPEQIDTKGQCGEWTDAYALAATVWFCLTGRAPHEAPEEKEEPKRKLPRRLEAILAKGLEPDRSRRYASVEAFQDALRPVWGKQRTGAGGAAAVLAAVLLLFFVSGEMPRAGKEASRDVSETGKGNSVEIPEAETGSPVEMPDAETGSSVEIPLIFVEPGVYFISGSESPQSNWAVSREEERIILWPEVWDSYAMFRIEAVEVMPGYYRIFPLEAAGRCLTEGEDGLGLSFPEESIRQMFRFRQAGPSGCLIQSCSEAVAGCERDDVKGEPLLLRPYDQFAGPAQTSWTLIPADQE